MGRRFVSIWFRYLTTDWFTIRHSIANVNGDQKSSLRDLPFVLRTPIHGRMVITAANSKAEMLGIRCGMVLADARAIVPELQVMDDKPEQAIQLLKRIAEWCIRFTPVVAVDSPDGLFFDATGCAHLWGGEAKYLSEVVKKINARGYSVRASIADTPGVAWAVARFGKGSLIVEAGSALESLLPLPPESLRLEEETVDRLHKLGLHEIRQFINMPRSSLRRRFGQHFLMRLDMALGTLDEPLEAIHPPEPYQERLPCMEPILTATGIELALKQLLEALCHRLFQEQKGLRSAIFKCYRVDGKIESIQIATTRATHNVNHLFKLFEIKIPFIEPALGIELFILDAPKVEDHLPQQEKMWEGSGGLDDARLSELIDRLGVRIGGQSIKRYLPDEHYWPERSFKPASGLEEEPASHWRTDKLRPLQLLKVPEKIEVTAPIPDYPPMLFRYRGKLHKIIHADGPERIEQEWWLQQGQHRDYYHVEDEQGFRYWIFRSGHYDDKSFQWYIHGFFA